MPDPTHPDHPAGRGSPAEPSPNELATADAARHERHLRLVDDEDGSLVAEYGLIAVVAATVAGVIIQWASSGALVTMFNALIRQARDIVGA